MLIFPRKASTITGFSPIDNSKNDGCGFSGQEPRRWNDKVRKGQGLQRGNKMGVQGSGRRKHEYWSFVMVKR